MNTHIDRPANSRCITALFFVVAILVLPPVQRAAAAPDAPSVLVLDSYHKGNVWGDDILEGIISRLTRYNPDIRLFVEYMDTKRHKPEYIFPLLDVLYRYKYSDIPLDVIIASDNNALNFVLAHRAEPFMRVPVVFCGINNFTEDLIAGYDRITGVTETADFEGTLRLALSLHPDTRTVAVVGDTTTTGIATAEEFSKVRAQFADRVEFLDFADFTVDELKEGFASLPDHSIVLATSFARDLAGRVVGLRDMAEIARDYCAAPIYTTWDTAVGVQAVGGLTLDGQQQGAMAADMAVRILEGESADAIPVMRESPTTPLFDFAALRRFGIPTSRLPPGSVILNAPESAFYRHRKLIMTAAGIILLQTVVLVGLIISIRRQRRIQRELREKEAFSSALFEYNPVETIVVDRKGRIVQANRARTERDGHQPVLGQIMYKEYANGHTVDMYSEMTECMRTGEAKDFPAQEYNGRHLSITIAPFPAGAIIISRDITEQRQTERRLASLNECFLSFGADPVRNIESLVSFCGEQMRASFALYNQIEDDELLTLAHWNAPADLETRERADGHVCNVCNDVVHRENDDVLLVRNLGETAYGETDPTVVRYGLQTYVGQAVKLGDMKVGSLCAVYTEDFAPSDNDLWLMGVLASAIGIEEARHRSLDSVTRLESQVLQSQKLESLGVLAGGIAHDFNNLLMGVQGNAELALMDLPPEAQEHKHLSAIESSAKRAAELCQQLLAYSGKGQFFIEPLNLSTLVHETGNLVDVLVSKKVRIEYDLSESVPDVEGDATQLRQVVMNLITNASEAVGDEEGTITVSTGLRHCDQEELRRTCLGEDLLPGAYVFLKVADTGCGIDQETQAKMFDPFYTTKFTGRGLGLAAALGIVRGHKGTLEVSSTPGVGTDISILLPPALPTGRRYEPAKLSSDHWAGSGMVLLADDEESVREVGALMLKRLGFTVLIAADGQETVDRFREHAREVVAVLLDTSMPRLSGAEAFAEMQAIRDDVPVILTSGYGEEVATSEFPEKALAGFVTKPYELNTLRSAMMRALTGPRKRQPGNA